MRLENTLVNQDGSEPRGVKLGRREQTLAIVITIRMSVRHFRERSMKHL
jgi:hypothetical protein